MRCFRIDDGHIEGDENGRYCYRDDIAPIIAERDKYRELLFEANDRLKEAKRIFCPHTSNSLADDTIARIAAALGKGEGDAQV
jgi:hypothetical protein